MVYRSEAGNGTFGVTGMRLRWDAGADGLQPEDEVIWRVFAVEMVLVPPGPFYLGSGGEEQHGFVAGGTIVESGGVSTGDSLRVTSAWDGCVADTEGCLWALGAMDGGGSLDVSGLPGDRYPIGLEGFYVMKYEVSQQQYVDFLNTLPAAQAQARAYTSLGGAARHGISVLIGSGEYRTSLPNVANGQMSWMDHVSYLDWAGLRPMTELEYEKAARGSAGPVAGEYAWGSASVVSTGGVENYLNIGEAGEMASQGNAVYTGSNPGGPARVGVFAGGATSREQAGASYWGVMELSGNLWERVITAGNAAGRSYSGLHGDGVLTAGGSSDVTGWPVSDGSPVAGDGGGGLRGGAYTSAAALLKTSTRTNAIFTVDSRNADSGSRGVRGFSDMKLFGLTVGMNRVAADGGTITPVSGAYAPGTSVQVTATADEGFTFGEWVGDITSTENPVTVSMDSSVSLTANFYPVFNGTIVQEVTNPTTGLSWMDRNLGAARAATSSTDSEAYGDLYQWGRGADGHESITSTTTTTLSTGDNPGHSDFILGPGSSYDWRTPQNDNLWQGASGINNPCPDGYRLPTQAEWDSERLTWESTNLAGAIGSSLQLPAQGSRNGVTGEPYKVGEYGYYWSSTVDGTKSVGFSIVPSNASFTYARRAYGYGVRCVKDYPLTLTTAVEGQGSLTPAPGSYDYVSADEITLTATPDAGYVFARWSGDMDGSENPLTINIYEDMTVTAVFGLEGKDYGTAVVDVTNPTTGKTWMDRNLGASQAAESSDDTEAYGDLYQWGRAKDGHESDASSTTTTLSTGDKPGHSDFIIVPSSPYDWRNPKNDNLWQGIDGINNPCPDGYRLPTQAEWDTERQSWESGDLSGAIESLLQLPTRGNRIGNTGALYKVGDYGYYWSSTVNGTSAIGLNFVPSTVSFTYARRAYGYAVRCTKDEYTLSVTADGNGTVSPTTYAYAPNAQTQITATPGEGAVFVRWSGDASGSDNPLTVTMDSDKTITAVFGLVGRDYETAVVEVTNSTTGRTWMDRNLGSSQAATSSTDTESYGGFYQWGRLKDGHQLRNSPSRTTLSNTDQPDHSDFIASDGDWRSPRNDNLWQGEDGINNPCPDGFRIPTQAEWIAEYQSWSSGNTTGALSSVLKLSSNGRRHKTQYLDIGTEGYYWSSTVNGGQVQSLRITSSATSMFSWIRGRGYAVRCIKDEYTLTVSVQGDGTTTPTLGVYAPGTEAQISATPGEGAVFVGWSGDASGDDNPLTITMDTSKTITAIFGIEGKDNTTTVTDVTNPTTGRTWMDRNLGAFQVAGSSNDDDAYGDLYQWGRAADGHEFWYSDTISQQSTGDDPDHEDFILASIDWRNPKNDNLWQGANGINNPCPEGYRLPTRAEWDAERLTWSSLDLTSAHSSVLKLPAPGYRNGTDGSINGEGTDGRYWSSTPDDVRSNNLRFTSSDAFIGSGSRSNGYSVRCIKDEYTLSVSVQGDGTATPTLGVYAPGTDAQITATPSEGAVFVQWSGDASGTDNPLTVTMDSDKTITAIFGIEGKDNTTTVSDVTNPTTGRTWMDRNLGASRVATGSTDSESYGDLYQWGRAADGHEKRNSTTTTTTSTTDTPGHGNFITTSSSPFDWRNPQNDNLWQGVDGVNNPCPAGFRLPTEAEWDTERQSWSSDDSAGAIGSPLKLPVTGVRLETDGSFRYVNSYGYYWSSSVGGTAARRLYLESGFATMSSRSRAKGISVRCIKDEYSLSVSVQGDGTANPTLGVYAPGIDAQITATPNAGAVFVGWSGDASGTDNPLTLTMDANKTITAIFGIEGKDNTTTVTDVTNPTTGRTWMDRNLGASRVATGSTDSESYGDLYQWGRAADGHEKRNSATTTTTSTTDTPGHGGFIIGPSDWRSPQNNNLWQGANGINNPCPTGFRLPTESEWDTERQSWNSDNGAGAIDSPLKLPVAGFRSRDDGSLINFGSFGHYWSSSVDGTFSRFLLFSSSYASMSIDDRARGASVRCIKHEYSLSVSVQGDGTANPTLGDYAPGIDAQITATPGEGAVFVGWSGDASGTDNPLTLTMDSDKTITAIFGIEGKDNTTTVTDVTNPTTGRTWMDRNLGASRIATGSADADSYGDLYQWGRAADGHETRTSATTTTQSSSDTPGHGSFITGSNDWRNPKNDNLWQGTSGTNNPCPSGYRLPTESEWNSERTSWSSNNTEGAYASPLKLPATGFRQTDGTIIVAGSNGDYWSSTISGTNAKNLGFFGWGANVYSTALRAEGRGVRCIKN